MSIYTNAANGQAADPSGTSGAIQKAKDMTQDPSTHPADASGLHKLVTRLMHVACESGVAEGKHREEWVSLVERVRAALAAPQPAPTSEPVAIYRGDIHALELLAPIPDGTFLYTHPYLQSELDAARERASALHANLQVEAEPTAERLGLEGLNIDRVLSIADEHAADSAEDGTRTFDRGGLMAFADDCVRVASQTKERTEPTDFPPLEAGRWTAEPVALRAKLGAALLAHPNAVRTLIEEALNMLETPTAERPCAVCNGAGVIGTPGAPCPFCKLHALGVEHKRLGLEGQDALALALKFHEVYERLAPTFGYETRQDTRAFDPESKNGRLMVAVCGELLAASQTKERESTDFPPLESGRWTAEQKRIVTLMVERARATPSTGAPKA